MRRAQHHGAQLDLGITNGEKTGKLTLGLGDRCGPPPALIGLAFALLFGLIDQGAYFFGHIVVALPGFVGRHLHGDREKALVVVIAGDVFDKAVPSVEALQEFEAFLLQLADADIPVCAIAGNHDSAERLSFGSLLARVAGIEPAA